MQNFCALSGYSGYEGYDYRDYYYDDRDRYYRYQRDWRYRHGYAEEMGQYYEQQQRVDSRQVLFCAFAFLFLDFSNYLSCLMHMENFWI